MDDNQKNSRSPNEADLTKDALLKKQRNYETLTINLKHTSNSGTKHLSSTKHKIAPLEEELWTLTLNERKKLR